MDDYTSAFDKRVEQIVQTQLDQLFDRKISPFIKKKVTDLHSIMDHTTMESLIDLKLQAQMPTTIDLVVDQEIEKKIVNVEQDLTKSLETTIAKTIDKAYQTDIQPKIRSTVDRTSNDLQKTLVDLEQKLDSQSKATLFNIRQEALQTTNKINKIKHQVENLDKLVKNATQTVQQACEDATLSIHKDTTTNLEYVAQEANESINNLVDIFQAQIQEFRKNTNEIMDTSQEELRTVCKTHISTLQNWKDTDSNKTVDAPKLYHKNERVFYIKNEHDLPRPVTIVEVHYDDEGEAYYTIEFPTGQQKQTVGQQLSYTQPQQLSNPISSRFHAAAENRSYKPPTPMTPSPRKTFSHGPSKVTSNTAFNKFDDDSSVQELDSTEFHAHHLNKEREIFAQGPDAQQVAHFHRYFQGTIDSKDNILSFYQQLQTQGRKYGIYLLPIQDVRKDIDLCPVYIQPIARRSMMLTIFQKLQREECMSVDYVEGRNYINQYSTNSDGYKVLYQLLRLVHPFLLNNGTLYNTPFLSHTGNLFKYADQLRNYILVQQIQKRIYTEKEKSEMFIQNIDDDSYKHTRAKCLAELEMSLSPDGIQVNKSDLRFENLPTTLQQYHDALSMDTSATYPVVRAMKKNPRSREKQYTKTKTSNGNYKPEQCPGCGQWNHPITQCKFVPKVSLAMQYIKTKPRHVEKLVKEFKRINSRQTKTGTVRVLASSGALEVNTPEDYLQFHDVDIPMEDVIEIMEEQQE